MQPRKHGEGGTRQESVYEVDLCSVAEWQACGLRRARCDPSVLVERYLFGRPGSIGEGAPELNDPFRAGRRPGPTRLQVCPAYGERAVAPAAIVDRRGEIGAGRFGGV